MFTMRSECKHGHVSMFTCETEVAAELHAAQKRVAVCEVCGYFPLMVTYASNPEIPEAPATEPEAPKKKK